MPSHTTRMLSELGRQNNCSFKTPGRVADGEDKENTRSFGGRSGGGKPNGGGGGGSSFGVFAEAGNQLLGQKRVGGDNETEKHKPFTGSYFQVRDVASRMRCVFTRQAAFIGGVLADCTVFVLSMCDSCRFIVCRNFRRYLGVAGVAYVPPRFVFLVLLRGVVLLGSLHQNASRTSWCRRRSCGSLSLLAIAYWKPTAFFAIAKAHGT